MWAQARVFQNSRCALSGAPLELPAVHFLCGHSFNARALGEAERECPLCAPQAATILGIRAQLRAGAAEQVRASGPPDQARMPYLHQTKSQLVRALVLLVAPVAACSPGTMVVSVRMASSVIRG